MIQIKTEEGVVIEVTGDIAKIKAGKHTECKDCGACPGNNAAIVTAKNQIGAKPGERVNFEVKEANALKAAFVVFVLPLLAVFIGAIIGGTIGGVIALIIGLIFIKKFDKRVGEDDKSLPVIIRIIK